MIAIFFDLDNTIYDSRQYFLGAFKEIASYLTKKNNLPEKKIYLKLANIWQKKTSAYPYLFNDLLKILEIKDKKTLKIIVGLFNQYQGRLKSYPDVRQTLKALKMSGHKLGIITDGNMQRQAKKIQTLGIKSFFDIIVYTKKIAEKPSRKPFLAAMRKLRLKPHDCIYVGDNPKIDFKGAKACGIKTIRILKGEFKTLPKNKYIDYEIKKFKDILNIRELKLCE